MLMFLGAFAALPLLLPWLVSRIGARAFYVAAVLPALAFAHALVLAPAVFAGNIPFEEYRWIPAIDVSLSMRMDVLGWILTLVVTGVGAALYTGGPFTTDSPPAPGVGGPPAPGRCPEGRPSPAAAGRRRRARRGRGCARRPRRRRRRPRAGHRDPSLGRSTR